MKKITFCLVTLAAAFTAKAQTEYLHAIGASYIIGIYSVDYSPAEEAFNGGDYEGSFIGGYPGITYNPRINFVMTQESSLSITSYPTVAFSIVTNSRGGAAGTFAFEAPLLGQWNFGTFATALSRANVGGFFAAGYSTGFYSGIRVLSGPTAQAGFRFHMKGGSYTLRAYGTLPLGLETGEKAYVFGGSLLYNLEIDKYRVKK